MIGLGFKSDQYEGIKIGTLLIHLGANIARSDDMGWRVAYTFEVPTDQGTMYKNTSHSLSLHWYFKRTPKRCIQRFDHSPNNNQRARMKRKNKTFRF